MKVKEQIGYISCDTFEGTIPTIISRLQSLQNLHSSNYSDIFIDAEYHYESTEFMLYGWREETDAEKLKREAQEQKNKERYQKAKQSKEQKELEKYLELKKKFDK